MSIDALGSGGSVESCAWDASYESEDDKIEARINLIYRMFLYRKSEVPTFTMKGCPGTITVDIKYDGPTAEDMNGPDDSYKNESGEVVRDA